MNTSSKFDFLYFYKIEQNIKYYNSNYDTIVSLKLIDKELNNFSIDLNILHDYDIVNSHLSKFKTTLKALEKKLKTLYPNNTDLQQKLKKSAKTFQKKAEDIEYFKSLSASLISGSHFLYDLQRTISDDQKITVETKSLVNEALFYLLFCLHF